MVRFLRAIASWMSRKKLERDVRLAVAKKGDPRLDYRGSFDLFGWVLVALAVWGVGVGLGKFHLSIPIARVPQSATGTIYVYYAHLDQILVEEGQWVKKGDPVGVVGSTGYVMYPEWNKHLHFAARDLPPTNESCWDASCWLNPDNFLGKDGWLDSPVPGTGRCGSPFGASNPLGGQSFHNGIDLACQGGGKKALAVADGQVVYADWWPSMSKANHRVGHGQTVVLAIGGERTISQEFSPKLGWLVVGLALLALLWRGCGRVLGLLLPAVFLAGWVVAVTFAAQAGILDKEIPVGAVVNWPPKIEWPTISSEVRVWVSGDKGPEGPEVVNADSALPEFNIKYWNGSMVHFYVKPEVWEAAVAAQKEYPYCDPRLSIAVAFSESPRYNNTVPSPVGAAGTWQFMPETWSHWSPDPSASRSDIQLAAKAFCRYAKVVGLFEAGSEQEFVQAFAYQAPVWNKHEGQARFAWRLWQELKRRMP